MANEVKKDKDERKFDFAKFSRNADAVVKKCTTCSTSPITTAAGAYQEQLYYTKERGTGMRVMNPSLKGYRCTICQTIHNP